MDNNRPPPLIRLVALALQSLATELLRHQHAAGFGDTRASHNVVFGNLPGEGIRLTDLANRADMTKQAMSELVADLEQLGYLYRSPDPDDRRAKRIHFTERGWVAVESALRAFDEMETRLARQFGAARLQDLREMLTSIAGLDSPGS